jgi:hypothetical protein
MRTAYSGRAAAYELKGDYAKALADHQMVVLYYAIEVEILINLDNPDRANFLTEAAQAYRARGKCLEALGRQQAAQGDRKRADGLESEGRKLARRTTTPRDTPSKPLRLTNAWTEPVTVMIAGDIYRLGVGDNRTIIVATDTVAYEMQAGTYRERGTLQAGKTYTIRVQAK